MTRLLLAALALAPLAAPARAADNAPPDGFVALFNGKDLTGWRETKGNGKKEPGDITQWKAENGTIAFAGAKANGGSHNLVIDKAYRDFVLLVDWKFDGKGTTGLYVGPAHVKIWDHTKTKGDAAEGSGSLGYGPNRVPVLKKADKPLGEWNTFEITVQGGLVSVKLNGEVVIDKAPKKAGKDGLTIAFQDHGTPVWFKNVYLKELPAMPAESN